MTFSYQEINPEIKRSIIPLILKSSNVVILYDAIIDSGSDYCIFTLDIAPKLGVDLLNKNKVNFMGVGKEKIKGFWGGVELRIANKTYETKVIFADINDVGYGILGQQGFFDHFDVKLSYQKQTIEIEPLKIPN